MSRAWSLAVCAGLLLAASSSAQTPAWRFQWQPGKVLNYHVEQVTSATEVAEGKKTSTSAKLSNDKRWQVLSVDAAGVATLQMSLTSLRIETTTPQEEVMLFDSANLDKSTPQLREQLAKFVGTPLVILRVDARGRVVEVKECRHGPASRFESELPFILNLPDDGPRVGQAWERAYAISIEGNSEKIAAVQGYACKAVAAGKVTVSMTTTLKAVPSSPTDQMPLLQMQPAGEVVFDVQSGCLQSARLNIDKELKNQQGEGSSYRFQSSYSEQLVGGR